MKQRLIRIGCDAGLLAGAGICAYGFWLAWHPIGFIAAGSAVAAYSFLAGYSVSRGRG